MSRGPLLIVGASGRAAAASAIRAGFEPFVIDLFADADTKRLCPTVRCPIEQYPESLPELAKQAPPGPWIYTGGLENRPRLLDRLARDRPLSGNNSRLIRNVRNPYIFHSLLTAHHIDSPAVCPIGRPAPDDRRWLRKPFRGAGGHGIAWYDYHSETARRADYIQEYIDGVPGSALYVSMLWCVYLLGVSRQLVGSPWLHAPDFAYCGSIGPLDADPDIQRQLKKLGRVVTQFGPRLGFFGIDFIEQEQHVFPIEVNPRYTASVEIFDYGFREALLFWHWQCAMSNDPDSPEDEWREPTGFEHQGVVGKAIYYAPRQITFPASGPWDESLAHCTDVWRRPDYADIPDAGSAIEPGHPVLTVLAEAGTESECLARLKSRAAELDQLFGHTPAAGHNA